MCSYILQTTSIVYTSHILYAFDPSSIASISTNSKNPSTRCFFPTTLAFVRFSCRTTNRLCFRSPVASIRERAEMQKQRYAGASVTYGLVLSSGQRWRDVLRPCLAFGAICCSYRQRRSTRRLVRRRCPRRW